MELLRLIRRESGADSNRILYAAIASGLANGLFMAIINAGAGLGAADALRVELIAAALASMGLYAALNYYALRQAVTAAETALLRLRLRIMGKVRRCGLRFIERQGDLATFLPLSEDAGLISQGALTLAAAAQSVLVVVFAGLYLLWLSPPTFLAAVLVYLTLMPLVMNRQQLIAEQLRRAAELDARFFARFAGLLAGFKELKLNRRENDALFADIRAGTRQASHLKRDASTQLARNVAFYFAMPNLVLFTGVFVVPALTPEASETVHKITATILFMNAPLGVLINALPMVARVEMALGRLQALERAVDGAVEPADAPTAPRSTLALAAPNDMTHGFEQIELRDLYFRYSDRDGQRLFGIGPIDLRINAGELLFIVGGNGSGKSTLLKVLTGLYAPDAGVLRLDGQPLPADALIRYRALFTTVFTDFHLSRRLYGIPGLSPAEVNGWLETLEIADKTRYTEHGFDRLDLSTGQKKRLAIAAAMMKRRPICVFDEPAADQDPPFRKRLYEELMPSFRAAGRTLIVVSHDDRYFHVADRVLEMRDAVLQPLGG